MANLKDSPNFAVYDDYYTPKKAWAQINHIIPKNKVIWEACCLKAYKSESPDYLKQLGNQVVYDKEMNCLTDQPESWDMIISNPPYDTKLKVPILKRFVALDKPFILVMNSMNTFSKYMREVFAGNLQHLQVITPDDKIQYNRLNEDGTLVPTNNCSFYSCYVCYKCEIPQDKLWLDSSTVRKKKKPRKEINWTPALKALFG